MKQSSWLPQKVVWTRGKRDLVKKQGNCPDFLCYLLWFCVTKIASSSCKLSTYITHQIDLEYSHVVNEQDWYFYGVLSLEISPWTQVLVAIAHISDF